MYLLPVFICGATFINFFINFEANKVENDIKGPCTLYLFPAFVPQKDFSLSLPHPRQRSLINLGDYCKQTSHSLICNSSETATMLKSLLLKLGNWVTGPNNQFVGNLEYINWGPPCLCKSHKIFFNSNFWRKKSLLELSK